MKNNTILTLSVVVLLLVNSCSTTKSVALVDIPKGTRFIIPKEVDGPNGIRKYKLEVQETNKKVNAILSLKEQEFLINGIDANDLNLLKEYSVDKDLSLDTEKGFRPASGFSYYEDIVKSGLDVNSINQVLEIGLDTINISANYFLDNRFVYSENKPVFQTLTIPFKIRPAQGVFPTSVSTGFNAGFALGYNWNRTSVRTIRNSKSGSMVGYRTNSISYVTSLFAGLTTVGLNSENTEMDVSVDQTVLGVSFGLVGVFKVNSLNIGPAIGVDFGTANSDKWIYQGELWAGIVLGIDLFK